MHGDNPADPNLTPLLDVVLQLIMFFMITANLTVDQLRAEINLPVAEALVPKEKEDEHREKYKEKIDGTILINLNRDNEIVGIPELPGKDAEGRLLQTREMIKSYLQREMTHYERIAKKENRK